MSLPREFVGQRVRRYRGEQDQGLSQPASCAGRMRKTQHVRAFGYNDAIGVAGDFCTRRAERTNLH